MVGRESKMERYFRQRGTVWRVRMSRLEERD
jgi:hypothetical protein